MSERGRCEASLKSPVSKLKSVTKKRPECLELTLALHIQTHITFGHIFEDRNASGVHHRRPNMCLYVQCQCQFRAFWAFFSDALVFTGQVFFASELLVLHITKLVNCWISRILHFLPILPFRPIISYTPFLRFLSAMLFISVRRGKIPTVCFFDSPAQFSFVIL